MNCDHAQKLVSLYLAGDLGGRDLEDLMAHLAECETCRKAFEEAKRYEAALKSIFQESVSKSRSPKSRVLRRIKSEGDRKHPKSLINWFVFIMLMAVLCLLIIIAYVSYEKIKQENIQKAKIARIQMSIILRALGEYKAEYGAYPLGDKKVLVKALQSPGKRENKAFLDLSVFAIESDELIDPWEKPYLYRSTGETALIYSAGPNMKDDDGLNDDVRP